MKLSDLKDYQVIGSTGMPQATAPTASSPTMQPQEPVAPKAPDTRSFGQKAKDFAYGAGQAVTNFIGAKGIADQFGADIARARATTEQEKNLVEYPKAKAVLGSALQTGALLIPGAGAGAGMAAKVAAGAGTGLLIDAGSQLQENPDRETVRPGVATVVGAALPVAGAGIKLGSKVVGRLFKGIGSGVSGVPMTTIDTIVQNPQVAKQATERLAKNGNAKVLEENSRTILNGVSTIRKQASDSYRAGLEQLAAKDIKPDVFRSQTQAFLDKYGVMKKGGTRELSGVEFTDPKNLKKASELVDRLNKVELNGKTLRKLADDVESAMYKTATSDERLSYNAFLKDFAASLRGAIKNSTSKLGEIDAKYSADMQLVEAIEDTFGNVNFKNLPEVVKASQKLEGLFNQKGLTPEVVDKFLERIGVSAKNFRTAEAVRQISNKSIKGSEVGTSFGEMTRAFSSAMITPQDVSNIAIKTGLAKEKVVPLLKLVKQMSPAARTLFLDTLLKLNR